MLIQHDRDKVIALLKSVAAECDQSKRNAEHTWARCRHCLAVAELECNDVRLLLREFLVDVARVGAEPSPEKAK